MPVLAAWAGGHLRLDAASWRGRRLHLGAVAWRGGRLLLDMTVTRQRGRHRSTVEQQPHEEHLELPRVLLIGPRGLDEEGLLLLLVVVRAEHHLLSLHSRLSGTLWAQDLVWRRHAPELPQTLLLERTWPWRRCAVEERGGGMEEMELGFLARLACLNN